MWVVDTMIKYRKKPVVIEAVQWIGKNLNEIFEFIPLEYLDAHTIEGKLEIHTLEGTMIASINNWIIKGVQGEFYPIKNNIFEETYEKVI